MPCRREPTKFRMEQGAALLMKKDPCLKPVMHPFGFAQDVERSRNCNGVNTYDELKSASSQELLEVGIIHEQLYAVCGGEREHAPTEVGGGRALREKLK